MGQFSEAVLLAANGTDVTLLGFIPHALHDLATLEAEARPECLSKMAYEWCPAIYANRGDFNDWENLLLVCLELGFRHFDPRVTYSSTMLTDIKLHRGLVDVVFKSQEIEATTDLLQALTTRGYLEGPAAEIVGICTGHIVSLQNLGPFSPRLRLILIRFVETVGYKGFEGVGVEKLIELLDRLCVTIEEVGSECPWALLLLDVILSPDGTHRLSHWYWELLVELAFSPTWSQKFTDTDPLKIAKSLTEAEEWGKLECWIGIAWIFSMRGDSTEEDLEQPTLSLFRGQPDSAQKFQKWMEKWSQRLGRDVPESFQRILAQAHEAVKRQVAS